MKTLKNAIVRSLNHLNTKSVRLQKNKTPESGFVHDFKVVDRSTAMPRAICGAPLIGIQFAIPRGAFPVIGAGAAV